MNKFNRNKSKKIKAIMRSDPFGRITYKQARKLYRKFTYDSNDPIETPGGWEYFTVVTRKKD